MIRLAVQGDVPRLVDLCEQFYLEAEYSDIASWDGTSIADTLASMVDSESGILIVLELDGAIVGIAGGLIYPLYFNSAHKTGQEIFWWVSPDHRGKHGNKLLDELEAEAKRRGAQSFTMIALDKLNPEMVARSYARRGYRATERSYMRRL